MMSRTERWDKSLHPFLKDQAYQLSIQMEKLSKIIGYLESRHGTQVYIVKGSSCG
jgi:hypothetical protein